MDARMKVGNSERVRAAALLSVFVAPVVGFGVVFMTCGILGVTPALELIAAALVASFALVFVLGYATFAPLTRRTTTQVKVISIADRFDAAA